MLFRNYDYAGLTAQYRLIARHLDLPEIIDRMNARSEAIRASLNCILDVSYGDLPGEKLDIFTAPIAGSDVHLFIHGGYWQAWDKSMHSFIAAPFVNSGSTFVAINYSLAPAARMDQIVAETRRAITWVFRNIAKYNGNPRRIFVSGHSAGGHLVSMLMATDWTPYGLPNDFIRGAVPMSGLFDLEPIQLSYLNEKLKMDAQEAFRNSPLKMEPLNKRSTIVIVGEEETDEYLRQSSEMTSKLKLHDVEVELIVYPGVNHFTLVEEFCRPDSYLVQRCLAQMAAA